MNFLKRIFPKVVAFLIIVYLSFTLIGCPSDRTLTEFQDTYNTYLELVKKENALDLEYNKCKRRYEAVISDIRDLNLAKMSFSSLKVELYKFSLKALPILEEQQETLNEQITIISVRSHIISELQGNVVKITDLSKKLLAQEIADKLRERNNLSSEVIRLYKKEIEYFYSSWEDIKLASQEKMILETAFENIGERYEKIEEGKERIQELNKAIRLLDGEISDLKAKLDSLGP